MASFCGHAMREQEAIGIMYAPLSPLTMLASLVLCVVIYTAIHNRYAH